MSKLTFSTTSLVAIVLGLLVSGFAADQRQTTVVLHNVNIVDPVAMEVTKGHLVLSNGVITRFAADELFDIPFGSTEHDLEGKWVIPGLVDMHTHIWGNTSPGGAIQILGTEGSALHMQKAGVTAFLDLFSDEREIYPLRANQAAGKAGGARAFLSGACLTAPKGHCSEFVSPTRIIESPAGAEAEVREIAKMKPDVIKLVYDHAFEKYAPTVTRETMIATVQAAKKNGIKIVVHIGTWQDAREAAEAGADVITHLHSEEIPNDVVSALVANKVQMIPTLTVQTELLTLVQHPELLDNKLLKTLTTEELLNGYRNIDVNTPRMKFWLEYNAKNQSVNPSTLRKLAAAGLPLMTGTDCGNIAVFVGYSVHREMERMVAYGLTPWDALRAATTTPGQFLQQKFGVNTGDVANVVVLDQSPIENIANTKEIAMVFQDGKLVHQVRGYR